MWAIGAQKSFVWKMVSETPFLTGLAGVVGFCLGGAILLVLNMVGIEAPICSMNYFGGPVLVIAVASSVIMAVVVVFGGVGASSYPLP